ncbi:putative tetratricopeptide-like helical domain superfamily [Helianthus debilis subsp. tardiflorus]
MFDHASEVFDEMPERKCGKHVKSFNALLGACVSAKKFDKVDGIFTDLTGKMGVSPDIVSYKIMVKALCEMGSFDSAGSVFDEIGRSGCQPDLITFNTLLVGLYSNGRFVNGEKFWAKMMGLVFYYTVFK